MNKKVILRERKKHTARRVASARGEEYLPWMGGRGTYLGQGEQYLPWGTPSPHPDLVGGQGYLPWTGGGYLPWGTPSPVWTDTHL